MCTQIEQHLEVGGQDNAAEVLITFLFRYGHIPDTTRGKLDDRIRTNLTQATIIQTHGQGAAKGTADMTSVFQLESCIRVFQASYFILRRKLQKPNSDPSHSLLGYLVDSQWLRGERAEFHRKIPQQKSTHQRFSGGSSPIPARLPSNWRSNERPRNTLESAAGRKSWDNTQKKPQSPEKPTVSLDTDEEAEQLIASYGIKTDKQKQDIHDGSPSSPGKSKKGRNRKSNA